MVPAGSFRRLAELGHDLGVAEDRGLQAGGRAEEVSDGGIADEGEAAARVVAGVDLPDETVEELDIGLGAVEVELGAAPNGDEEQSGARAAVRELAVDALGDLISRVRRCRRLLVSVETEQMERAFHGPETFRAGWAGWPMHSLGRPISCMRRSPGESPSFSWRTGRRPRQAWPGWRWGPAPR